MSSQDGDIFSGYHDDFERQGRMIRPNLLLLSNIMSNDPLQPGFANNVSVTLDSFCALTTAGRHYGGGSMRDDVPF